MAIYEFDIAGDLGAQTGDAVSTPSAGTTTLYYILNESDAAFNAVVTEVYGVGSVTIPAGDILDITVGTNAIITLQTEHENLAVGEVLTIANSLATDFNTTYTVTALSTDGLTVTTSRDTTGFDDTLGFAEATGTSPATTLTLTTPITVARGQVFNGHTGDTRTALAGVALFSYVTPAGAVSIQAPVLSGSTRHKTSAQTGEMVYFVDRS